MTSGQVSTVVCDDGAEIAFIHRHVPSAPTIIFGNSLGATMVMWEPQIGHLGEDYSTICYDMRGHGRSREMSGFMSIDRLVRDVIAIAHAANIDRFYYCGLSLGGLVGLALAVRAPDRVDRLILANSLPAIGDPRAWNDRIRTIKLGGFNAIAESAPERWFMESTRKSNPKLCQSAVEMNLQCSPEGYAACCAALRDADLWNLTGLVDCRVLLIGGTHDFATPVGGMEAMAAAISQSSLIKLEAAHLSNLEQPDAFSDAIASFLDI